MRKTNFFDSAHAQIEYFRYSAVESLTKPPQNRNVKPMGHGSYKTTVKTTMLRDRTRRPDKSYIVALARTIKRLYLTLPYMVFTYSGMETRFPCSLFVILFSGVAIKCTVLPMYMCFSYTYFIQTFVTRRQLCIFITLQFD